jgi:hypothetical protein
MSTDATKTQPIDPFEDGNANPLEGATMDGNELVIDIPAPETSGTGDQPVEKPGRDSSGRFTAGNTGGPGNPHARRVSEFRAVLFKAVTDEDLKEIAATLLDQAKAGNLDATKILLDRLLGRPTQHNINETILLESEFTVTHECRQAVLMNPDLVDAICNAIGFAPQAA